jgi:hypothetical protein
MEHPQPRAEWARQMADTVQRKLEAEKQKHQRGGLTQAQAEQVWVAGMDQVVNALACLVQALRATGSFPQLKLVTYAHNPQGMTTYMRRGNLLSVKGLQEKAPTIDFEIDSAPPFRPDLLLPTIRVVSMANSLQPTSRRTVHGCFGVAVQGAVVWQGLDPAGQGPVEGEVEEMLRRFVGSQLLAG